jgi:small-conductance mechanosensitive channel
MTFDEIRLIGWMVPFVLVIGGFLVGIIFEKVVLGQLKKISARTPWESDEIVVAALQRMVMLWFGFAGIYAALASITIPPPWSTVIRKVLLVLVIVSVTVVVSRVAVGFVKLYSKKAEEVLPSTSIFTALTKVVVFSVGILVILQSLDVPITPILTALGVGGLGAAVALKDQLANLFAGFQVLLSHQVKPGDYVKLSSGEEGYVVDITWRTTTVRALQNNLIVVPNSTLVSSIVTNFSLPEKELSLVVPVGVSSANDLQKVERVTLEAAREVMQQVPGAVAEFEPLIRYQAMTDSGITLHVVLRAREFSDQALLRHEFIKRLHEKFRQESIEMPPPVRTVHVREKTPV